MTNIRNIDLNLLVVLDALLDERNVTRAARRLSYSQPAVSGMLRRLRDIFGDPLFVRTQRGLSPTPRALELAGPVKAALARIDDIFVPAGFEPGAADLVFTIAATDYAQYTVLAPLVERLRRAAPGVRLAIRPADAAAMAGQLESQQIDLAVTIPAMAPPNARSREILADRYVCAVRHDHPRVGDRLSLDEFCGFDQVLVAPGDNPFESPADAVLAGLGRRRRVVLSVPNFLILPRMLQAPDLLALIPERLAHAHAGQLKTLALPFELPGFSMIAAWHERTHRDPAHIWLRDLMVASAGSDGRTAPAPV
jgi:DNA-binding transcriptional LysR family regulator